MRRKDTTTTVTLECTAAEADVMDQMRGVFSRPNLCRIALWSLADHMALDPNDTVFDCREERGDGKRFASTPLRPKIK